jgi:hypothetical protein
LNVCRNAAGGCAAGGAVPYSFRKKHSVFLLPLKAALKERFYHPF